MSDNTAKPRVLKVDNVRVFRGGSLQSTSLWVVDGKIADPQTRFWELHTQQELAPHIVVDGRGCIVSPGFIDLQLNGGFGYDFSDPSITTQQILEVAQKLVATGVTAFCPTLVSSNAGVYREITSKYPRTSDAHTDKAANMLGLHLEGPFINRERKGAHNESVLLAPVAGMASLEQRYGSLENVSIVTLAPEAEGAMDTIEALSAKGIVVSAGHSVANVDTAIEAAERGLSMLT